MKRKMLVVLVFLLCAACSLSPVRAESNRDVSISVTTTPYGGSQGWTVVGQSELVYLTGSTDGITSVLWNFGDGIAESRIDRDWPHHSWGEEGTYTIVARVTWDNGEELVVPTKIAVLNCYVLSDTLQADATSANNDKTVEVNIVAATGVSDARIAVVLGYGWWSYEGASNEHLAWCDFMTGQGGRRFRSTLYPQPSYCGVLGELYWRGTGGGDYIFHPTERSVWFRLHAPDVSEGAASLKLGPGSGQTLNVFWSTGREVSPSPLSDNGAEGDLPPTVLPKKVGISNEPRPLE